MPTTLTDVDSFDAPALVPVDGDSATASSVTAEFQVLQNRTLYAKNRAASAKAEIDGLYEQVVDKYIPLEPFQVSNPGGISHSEATTTFSSVPSGNFMVSVVAGDKLRVDVGPIDFIAAGSTGSYRIQITEDVVGSGTPVVNDDRVYSDTQHRSISVPLVYEVTKTGSLAVDLQIKGDGSIGAAIQTHGSANFATYQVFRKIT